MPRVARRGRALALLLLGCAACSGESSAPHDESVEGEPALPPGTDLPPRSDARHCLPLDDAGAPLPLLSQTGCFTNLDLLTPAPDMIPYEVRSPLWSDGTHKSRQLVLPPKTALGLEEGGRFDFPQGTLLVKTFSVPDGGRPIETRFMERRGDTWLFWTYRGSDSGGEAHLLEKETEVTVDVGGGEALTWLFPDPAACNTCHDDLALGPRVEQLNSLFDYRGEVKNQLAALAAIGLFEAPLGDLDELPQLTDPADVSAPIEARARSYLHGNCAHCHRPGGWTPPAMTMDLRYHVPLADAHICDVAVQYDSAPHLGDLRIDPGNPDGSAIYNRMTSTGPSRMPPIGTRAIDPLGAELLRAWIEQVDCGD